MLFSVLEGKNPGKVFVDNAENPTQALALLPGGVCIGGYFDQEDLNESVSFLRESSDINLYWPSQGFGKLEPPSNATGDTEFLEFLDLPDELEHLKLVARDLPPGCSMRRIDNELIESCLWRRHIIHNCGTIDNFLKNGLGYCLMKETEIIVETYAAFWGAGHVEIGGITHENYKKSGYAYTTVAYLITKCAEKGFKTRWNAEKENTASVALGRKLGYKTERAFKLIKYVKI